ncbi:hypothetical protein L227DRAFT_353569 [Lentinus tigrinus ALCF2SS1-6]|uniref:Uncharacterized protein n=1 Tax=Lentinus tigrinus ALCF2SS1-6 TaxID=1328759 RepID=A0A5C2RUV9_9APHY|nr:hypothetical protein L227DRAFT_353569 [Lentinus tigrinus ALCF2SS1-6]
MTTCLSASACCCSALRLVLTHPSQDHVPRGSSDSCMLMFSSCASVLEWVRRAVVVVTLMMNGISVKGGRTRTGVARNSSCTLVGAGRGVEQQPSYSPRNVPSTSLPISACRSSLASLLPLPVHRRHARLRLPPPQVGHAAS